MSEFEEYPINYHHQLVSVLYNQELKEHLDDIESLQNRFLEDGKEYREMKRPDVESSKLEHLEEMKDYINNALANLAYGITHATQKIDDGLRMQVEDVKNLERQVREIRIDVDIKNEKRNRATISELHVAKTRDWKTLKIVEDPNSKWKLPRSKYRRQALDYSLLDHLGVLAAKPDSDQNGNARRTLSFGSHTSYRDTISHGVSLMSLGPQDGRQGMATLKRGAMPAVKRTAPPTDKIQEEEESKQAEEESEFMKLHNAYKEDFVQPRKKPSRQESVDSFQSTFEDLPSPSIIETVKSNEPFRFSLLPPIPDDFDNMFTAVDAPETIDEEPGDIQEVNNIQETSPGAEGGILTNPFEAEVYLKKEDDPAPARLSFDISTLPPPPPAPTSSQDQDEN